MTDVRGRELERRAGAGDPMAVRELIQHMAREGLAFFVCDDCGAIVPPLARDRHAYEHAYLSMIEDEAERLEAQNRKAWAAYDKQKDAAAKRAAAYGRLPIALIPPLVPRPPGEGVIGARPVNEPLWHHLMVRSGTRVRFFRDVSEGRSNLPHPGGHLPAASHFYAYGLSLIPDEGADPNAVREIRNHGGVRFLMGGEVSRQGDPTRINNDLPARTAVRPRRFAGKEVMPDPANPDLASLVPMHRLTVRGDPVNLFALQAFAVDLDLPFWVPGDAPVGVLCVIHGLRLHAVTG